MPGPITLVASPSRLWPATSRPPIWFLVGVTALDVALFTALASGAAPVLRRIGALPVVELVGGIALLWGGITSLRAAPAKRRHGPALDDVEERRALSSFLLGLLVAAANPHYWIWWVTAGLAFVEAARAHGASGLAWMLAALVGGVVAGTCRCCGPCPTARSCCPSAPSGSSSAAWGSSSWCSAPGSPGSAPGASDAAYL